LAFKRVAFENYSPIHPESNFARAFNDVAVTLRNMATYHMWRGGIEVPVATRMSGGYFREMADTERWHVNQDEGPTMLFTVVHGAGPTRGLTGKMSRADILPAEGSIPAQGGMEYFTDNAPIGEGLRLEPTDFVGGTVLCYDLDGHETGQARGRRLLNQAKFILPQPTTLPNS
jgi:hypothetical protein